MEQSDLGPYVLQYRIVKFISRNGVMLDKSHDWWERVKYVFHQKLLSNKFLICLIMFVFLSLCEGTIETV